MGRFDQKMREVERSLAKLTGNKTQAAKIRKGLEQKVRQAAVKALPKIVEKLVKSGRAGWANDPDVPGGAVLVERGTGCVLQDPKGNVIQRTQPVIHPPTPDINDAAFIQHLKDAGNELFVPYMYLDKKGNVTVGIGTNLENAQEAKDLPFFIRGTNKPAHDNHKINAYNKVKNSGLTGSKHFVFEPLTSIEISEADAVLRASNDLPLFLDDLKRQRFFRELDTFPVTAKMGLRDMIYTLGLPKLLEKFKRFNPAVRKRDWNFAAQESDRGSDVSSQRNQIVYQWFKEAERQEPLFVSVVCTKRIDLFFQ